MGDERFPGFYPDPDGGGSERWWNGAGWVDRWRDAPQAASTSYVAWNGETYQGEPPAGWHTASDGRWWPAGRGPEPVAPASPGPVSAAPPPPPPVPGRVPPLVPSASVPWWRRKRVLAVWAGILGLLILIGIAVPDPEVDEDVTVAGTTQTTEEATTITTEQVVTTEPVTTQVVTVAPTTTTEATTTTEEATTTTEEATTTTEVAFSDADIQMLAFRLLAGESMPALSGVDDATILTMADGLCAAGSNASTEQEVGFVILLVWAELDSSTQSMFDSDAETFARFTGLVFGAFCPEVLEGLE